MRKNNSILLLAAVISFGYLAVAQPPTQSQQAGIDTPVVAGTVVDALTQQPLAKALVRLTAIPPRKPESPGPSEGGASYGAETDSNGRFAFTKFLSWPVVRPGSPSGQYDLQVSLGGYITQGYAQKSWHRMSGTLTLEPGTRINDLVIRLIPTGAISGRVIEEGGKPPYRVFLRALRIGYNYSGQKQMSQAAAAAYTDERGLYQMSVPAGSYYLELTYPTGAQSLPTYRRHWRETPAGDRAYPTQIFYPGVPEPADATLVDVSPRQEVRDANFSLTRQPSFRVTGVLTSAVTSRTRTSFMVVLVRRDAYYASKTGDLATFSDPSGRFELRGVFPGTYYLVASEFKNSTGIGGGLPEFGLGAEVVALVVGSSNVSDLKIACHPLTSLSGRLVSEGIATGFTGHFGIYLLPGGTVSVGNAVAGVPEAGGSFLLKDLGPGSALPWVSGLTGNAYLKSAWLGKTDVLKRPLEIGSAGTSETLELVVDGRGAEVRGTALTANRQPAIGATIVVVPGPPMRDAKQLYKAVSADQFGHFAIGGIRPGSYEVFAFDEIDTNAWFDEEILKTVENLGVRVELEENERKALELSEIPAGLTTLTGGKRGKLSDGRL